MLVWLSHSKSINHTKWSLRDLFSELLSYPRINACGDGGALCNNCQVFCGVVSFSSFTIWRAHYILHVEDEKLVLLHKQYRICLNFYSFKRRKLIFRY